MKQCTNPPSKTDGAAGSRGVRADGRAKGAPSTMTAATTSTTTTTASTATPASTSVSTSSNNTGSVSSRSTSARESKGEPRPAGGKTAIASETVHAVKPSKHHGAYPSHPYPHHHHLQHHHQLSGKVNGKLGTGVDHLSALNMLPAHLRDMFLAAHLLRGYYQPVGPLISPLHLAQPPTSQHGPGLSGLLGKSGPDGGSPLPGPPQPPPSSTADSTDSDVLLTGTPGRPSVPTDGMTMAFHPYRPAPAAATVAAAAAAADADRCFRSIFAGGDLLPRSSQHQQQAAQAAYGAARYGPAAGGPPANLYGRPMQMHCPPAYLPQSYYAPSPYGQPPPPHPPPPPPEMYYAHAYPHAAHYYPKFAAPQYYPAASRRYYPGPAPGSEHLYEQAPPGGAPVPQPPPPPAGAQLVPAGPPQGPQHLDHYPYPAYPGYGSPGPGSGGQCYPRSLPPPPPFMDTHYPANCPCPMQCPKNVNAGSLIGIKASKGPVANKNNNTHIVQSQTSTIMSTEPITISSSSSSASSSASPAPAPLDIHSPITMASESASSDPSAQPGIHAHGYHHHGGHHGVQHHHHPSHQYHHLHHQYPRQPAPVEPVSTAGLASSTVAPSVVTVTTTRPATPPGVVTTATSADHHYHHHLLHQPAQPHHPAKMCYKTEQLIKPESSAELLSTPVHYGSPYHHHYHHAAMGYYHHPKLAELKEELPSHGGDSGGKLAGAPLPPYTIASKMALLETPELAASPARGSTGLSVPPMVGEAMQPPLIPRDGEKKGLVERKVGSEEKLSLRDEKTISPNAVVKQEIEEFKLDLGLVSGGALCKKEDFEETGPAMTPDLLDESIAIKKDRDEEKPPTSRTVDATYHQQQQQLHHLHHQHHLQLGPPPAQPTPHHMHHLQQVAAHHPHLHHHSATTNLLHEPPLHHHHHMHPHYALHLSQPQQQQQHQQPQPRVTGIPIELDDKEANNLLPPDSKSLLTELVLTTEASMESRNGPALPDVSILVEPSSKVISSSITTTISSSSSSSSGTDQHQSRDCSSSDNSLSLSDSLAIPSADADTDANASRRIPTDDAKVQSRDAGEVAQQRDTASPPSPVPIPASTVKRRPLLVACKKATPKHSPPNSYKNLIKRTNGTDEGEDLRATVECIEAVELSDDEEAEEEEEEEVGEEEEEEEEDDGEDEEDEEEEDDEEEDDEEGLGVEDVEDVELEEQRKVLAEQQRQRGAENGASRNAGGSKFATKKRPGTKLLTDSGRRKGISCARKLLTTTTTTTTTTAFVAPHGRHRRQAPSSVQKKLLSPPPAASRRPRHFSVKRVRRVFSTSVESLKRLPPALRGRLLGRSNVTLVRRTIRKRTLQSSETTPPRSRSPTLATSCAVPQQTADIADQFEAPKSPSPGIDMDGVASVAIEENQSQQKEAEACPSILLDQQQPSIEPHTDLAIMCEVAASEAPPAPLAIPMKPPLSNVDRTIDLVARGYFSEPEILTGCAELKLHSRAWLKRLKQQQQQEGRSHSEQSRGATGSKSGCPATKKGKKKASSSEDVGAGALEDRPAVAAEKKPKSKAKSSKKVPATEGGSAPCSIENSEPKGKTKSSSKENKKESKKKKQKLQDDGGQDSEHRGRKRAKVNKPNASQPATVAPIEETEAMYQRVTSTPIPPNNGLTLATDSSVAREAEEEHPKGGSILDESGVTSLDQSSVIDDRETDFDDAATMLVEDDMASVDTSVLVNRHNNNNNSAVTDKNNPSDEQCTIDEQVTLDAPLQAIIAEGKEGSELEPPEGMEPFMDEEQEEQLQQDQLKQPMQPMQPHDAQLLPPPVLVQEYAPRTTAPAAGHPLPDFDDEELEDEEEFIRKRGSCRPAKRRRSRSKSSSKKFSKKKRHRPANRGATTELEELIVPRKCTSIPRWSNGWTWEGYPFQGKVFLNSDDPPVLRTCYPAMRHSEGDIIRPRDCVLLRAGSKRAELPYVAKVAHLWENPEDGEMMMSLLWYYRPEHTEQGRQPTDGPDEVFASRHKDHNSVACIEDKCYVLTFSEYCRFRRQLKGLEENVEEQPSIVPPLRRENPRLPPAIVSPELVMYCQRVYEFRLKRLLKGSS